MLCVKKLERALLEPLDIAGQAPPLCCRPLTQLSILPFQSQLCSSSRQLASLVIRISCSLTDCSWRGQGCWGTPLGALEI